MALSLLLATAILVSEGHVTLRHLSVTYIPYDYSPEPRHAMFTEASEQIAYDVTSHITYTIGELLVFKPCIGLHLEKGTMVPHP